MPSFLHSCTQEDLKIRSQIEIFQSCTWDLKGMMYKQSQIAKVTISAIRKIKHSSAIVLSLF